MLRLFCACSTVFCVCLPCCFCRSRLVLFRSAACFVLFLHVFPATFIIFLWFGFSSFHMIPAVPYFFSPCFFISVFMPIFFIQKDLGLCGPNNVDWIKRVLGPIYLYPPKPFCQITVFCCKFAGQIMLTGSKGSWAQFIFICRSHSARGLYSMVKLYFGVDLYSTADLCFAVDYFYLHFFLWKFLALQSSWWVFGSCFSLGFLPHEPLGTDLQKWASTLINNAMVLSQRKTLFAMTTPLINTHFSHNN